ncbi:MAG: hypothetical protein AAF921_08485 [Cyanobacteria bacterium P01_D01_bin.44]
MTNVAPTRDNKVRCYEFAFAVTDIKPSTSPKLDRPKRGFTDYAERLNGRAAMIGFVALLAIEYLTGKGLLSWLGIV